MPVEGEAANTTSSTPAAAGSSSSASEGVPVLESLIACALGVASVAGVAALVEANAPIPTYHPSKGQRFDESHFAGRFSRMILACDPMLLFYNKEQVLEAREMLRKYKSGEYTDRQLWEARRVVDAAVHPDTGEFIPRPFRMSGYVPFNGPINVAMVASQSTLPLLFWSFVNQTQNAMVNFFNRNASSPMSNETLATSYGVAVGSALSIAFGLSTLVNKRYPKHQAKALMKWIAFPSAVVASSLNCYIVRSPEIETGVPLLDEDGQEVSQNGERSQVAARAGVHSTTLSRALLQAPVYFLPPFLLGLGPFKTLLQKNPRMSVPLTTFLLLNCFGVGLPATVALFPQISSIPASSVENQFRSLRDKDGKPYEVFYYNKGL